MDNHFPCGLILMTILMKQDVLIKICIVTLEYDFYTLLKELS